MSWLQVPYSIRAAASSGVFARISSSYSLACEISPFLINSLIASILIIPPLSTESPGDRLHFADGISTLYPPSLISFLPRLFVTTSQAHAAGIISLFTPALPSDTERTFALEKHRDYHRVFQPHACAFGLRADQCCSQRIRKPWSSYRENCLLALLANDDSHCSAGDLKLPPTRIRKSPPYSGLVSEHHSKTFPCIS